MADKIDAIESGYMDIADALQIVLDLAKLASENTFSTTEEYARRNLAILVVQDLIENKLGDD